MPHVVIEYSDNVARNADVRELVDRVHAAVIGAGVAPVAAVRTRAEPRSLYRIADGDSTHMFIAITIRLAAGRDAEHRQRLLDEVTSSARSIVHGLRNIGAVAFSCELQDIDPLARINDNDLHLRIGDER